MILPIKNVADWRYIRQHKQAQINKDFVHENTTKINKNYRVGDIVPTRNKSVFRYPYENFQTWTNGTINLRIGEVTNRIKPAILSLTII